MRSNRQSAHRPPVLPAYRLKIRNLIDPASKYHNYQARRKHSNSPSGSGGCVFREVGPALPGLAERLEIHARFTGLIRARLSTARFTASREPLAAKPDDPAQGFHDGSKSNKTYFSVVS
jgi:hypothetical protein